MNGEASLQKVPRLAQLSLFPPSTLMSLPEILCLWLPSAMAIFEAPGDREQSPGWGQEVLQCCLWSCAAVRPMLRRWLLLQQLLNATLCSESGASCV